MNKIFTMYEDFRKRFHVACFAKKKDMDGCASWMKRTSLYTRGVVGRETMNMGYENQALCVYLNL